MKKYSYKGLHFKSSEMELPTPIYNYAMYLNKVMYVKYM